MILTERTWNDKTVTPASMFPLWRVRQTGQEPPLLRNEEGDIMNARNVLHRTPEEPPTACLPHPPAPPPASLNGLLSSSSQIISKYFTSSQAPNSRFCFKCACLLLQSIRAHKSDNPSSCCHLPGLRRPGRCAENTKVAVKVAHSSA